MSDLEEGPQEAAGTAQSVNRTAPSINTTQHPSPEIDFGEDLYPSFALIAAPNARTTCLTKFGNKYSLACPDDTQDPKFGQEDKFIIDFGIIASQARTGTTPKSAVPTLNAAIQANLLKWHEITTGRRDPPPFDPKLFSVTFSETDQTFICSMPRSLIPIFYTAYLHNEFDFTGDTEGNKWKIRAQDHVRRLRKLKKTDDTMAWCHAIFHGDTTMGPASAFTALEREFSACGITIDPETFNRMTTKDKEQGANKYHVGFSYNSDLLPRDRGGFIQLTSLKQILMSDDPFCQDRITTWFKPENMLFMFGTCNKCYKNKQAVCICAKADKERKRPRPRDSADQAQKRIAARAAASSSSTFKF